MSRPRAEPISDAAALAVIGCILAAGLWLWLWAIDLYFHFNRLNCPIRILNLIGDSCLARRTLCIDFDGARGANSHSAGRTFGDGWIGTGDAARNQVNIRQVRFENIVLVAPQCNRSRSRHRGMREQGQARKQARGTQC